MANMIPFGQDMLTGKMLDSRQVKRGLACGCICPECKVPLEAVHGKRRDWFFRHAKGSTNNTYCAHPLETSIHLKAKELFQENTLLRLPKAAVKPGNQVPEMVFSEAGYFYITKAEMEYRRDGNDAIPDIALFSGDRKVYVEILVTHAVDDDKIEKLHKRGVPTLEIDLGKATNLLETMTEDEFRSLLFSDNSNKEWVYTEELYQFRKKLLQADYLRFKDALSDSLLRVGGCPLSPQLISEYYTTEDCGSCRYCIDISFDRENHSNCPGKVFCSAKAGFSLKDTSLTAEEIRASIEKVKSQRAEMIRYNQEQAAKREREARENNEKRLKEIEEKKIEFARRFDQLSSPRSEKSDAARITPRPKRIYKCIKCGKEGTHDSEFKAMRSSENQPICDDCILKGNYEPQDTKKIYYCPKCRVHLYAGRCGSFVCGWTLY